MKMSLVAALEVVETTRHLLLGQVLLVEKEPMGHTLPDINPMSLHTLPLLLCIFLTQWLLLCLQVLEEMLGVYHHILTSHICQG